MVQSRVVGFRVVFAKLVSIICGFLHSIRSSKHIPGWSYIVYATVTYGRSRYPQGDLGVAIWAGCSAGSSHI